MSDLISRQSAIEACLRYNGVGWVWSQILDEIEKLPSAQPEKRTEKHAGTHACDLISRQMAIDEAYSVIVDDAVYDVVQVETLEALPSVDAVEVIRCKDCYHYDEESEKCILNNSEMKPTDYCSYGSK